MSAGVRTFDRRRTMQSIHCACRDMGFDSEVRQAMQLAVIGKASMTKMSDVEIQKLRGHLNDLGWQPSFKKEGYRAKSPKGHVRKVYAIWGDLKRQRIWRETEHKSLDAFVARVCGVSCTEWLNPHQANKVIEALKAMQERAQ